MISFLWRISFPIKTENSKNERVLGEKAPGYMIPRRFIRVDSFPMNLSGKLDLKELPDPMEEPESDEQVIKPHNETEKSWFPFLLAF